MERSVGQRNAPRIHHRLPEKMFGEEAPSPAGVMASWVKEEVVAWEVTSWGAAAEQVVGEEEEVLLFALAAAEPFCLLGRRFVCGRLGGLRSHNSFSSSSSSLLIFYCLQLKKSLFKQINLLLRGLVAGSFLQQRGDLLGGVS